MPGFGANAVLAPVTSDLSVNGLPRVLVDNAGMLTGVPDVLVGDLADI